MSTSNDKQKDTTVIGVVTEALPNTMFRVSVPSDVEGEMREMVAYLSGKMRYHRIKVLVGDKVEVLPDNYGGEKGRVIKRL